MKFRNRLFATLAVAAFTLTACGNSNDDLLVPVVKLLAHESFVISEADIQAFSKETGIGLIVITAGDAGTMVASAVLASGNPTADVMFGVDNSLMPNALKGEGIFEPYKSPKLASVRSDLLQWTDGNLVTPMDYGDVCVNVDTKWFADKGLPVPASIDVLTLPQYKNLLVIQDPATSSPGMAFLLAVQARLGGDRLKFWEGLKANGVKIASSWSDAYYNDFTAGGGSGKYPLVVSYATSPVAEYVYAEEPKPTAVSTSVITEGCFRQIEYAGILRGTKQRAEAEILIDWLLSKEFQDTVAESMFVYPANTEASIPEAFVRFAGKVERPGVLPTSQLRDLQSELVAEWNRVMFS